PPTIPVIYTLSLHDALPISEFLGDFIREFLDRYRIFLRERSLVPFVEEYESRLVNIGREVRLICRGQEVIRRAEGINARGELVRSEEHTSGLQSRFDIVCRL